MWRAAGRSRRDARRWSQPPSARYLDRISEPAITPLQYISVGPVEQLIILSMSERVSYSHDTYLSPYTWRYGSPEMRRVWSELHRRRLWRRVWVALAEAEQSAGLVTAEQVADLKAHAEEIDLPRALAIEAEIHHDLMAEVRTYAEQCPAGGGIIHLGATSMDIEDNAEALRMREALDLLLSKLAALLSAFADQIERWADAPTMAFTHLQPAEPTTVGYRLAQYAQDVLHDYQDIRRRWRGGARAEGRSRQLGVLCRLYPNGRQPQRLERVLGSLTLRPSPSRRRSIPASKITFLSALAAWRSRSTNSPSTSGFCSRPHRRVGRTLRQGTGGPSAMPSS